MEKKLLTLEELKRHDPERYFQEVLEVNEFEGLKTLIDDSLGVISWEKLNEKGVVKLEGNKVEGIYWKGDLNIEESKLRTLWKFKEVNGDLICSSMDILEDIGELEKVEGILNLEGTRIKTLNKLRIVSRTLICNDAENLEDIGELEYIGGNLVLRNTQIKTLGKINKVMGGFLDISNTKIKTLGKLEKVRWGLYCNDTKTLESLGELEYVGGDLSLEGTKVKTLGKVTFVGLSLSCSGMETLEDLGRLERVGENMYIQNSKNLRTISSLEYIGGRLLADGCSIKLQLQISRKISNRQLLIKKEYEYDEFIDKIYDKYTRIKLDKFIEVFGTNISDIEDIDSKKKANRLLQREYSIMIKLLNKRISQIKKTNKWKFLTEKRKGKLRNQISELIKEFEGRKLKLETLGVKLE